MERRYWPGRSSRSRASWPFSPRTTAGYSWRGQALRRPGRRGHRVLQDRPDWTGLTDLQVRQGRPVRGAGRTHWGPAGPSGVAGPAGPTGPRAWRDGRRKDRRTQDLPVRPVRPGRRSDGRDRSRRDRADGPTGSDGRPGATGAAGATGPQGPVGPSAFMVGGGTGTTQMPGNAVSWVPMFNSARTTRRHRAAGDADCGHLSRLFVRLDANGHGREPVVYRDRARNGAATASRAHSGNRHRLLGRPQHGDVRSQGISSRFTWHRAPSRPQPERCAGPHSFPRRPDPRPRRSVVASRRAMQRNIIVGLVGDHSESVPGTPGHSDRAADGSAPLAVDRQWPLDSYREIGSVCGSVRVRRAVVCARQPVPQHGGRPARHSTCSRNSHPFSWHLRRLSTCGDRVRTERARVERCGPR